MFDRLRSPAGFCTILAAAMTAGRLMLFDFGQYFRMTYIPNHDMYQGASLFATSMQSMRLYGDLAWWNPVSNNGYAQYYQQLASPLAPTSNSPVFFIWAEMVRVLSLGGFAFPEYVQYLTVTYVISAFLAVLAFAAFASVLFKSRVTVVLVTMIATFSGIGVWESAWLYFQEPAVLFFLLAAALYFVSKPSERAFVVLCLALLVQFCAVNYWTLYDTWFIAIVAGAYAAVNRRRVAAACKAVPAMLGGPNARPIVLVLVCCGVTAGLWATVNGAAVAEQSRNYVHRTGDYRVIDAANRVNELRRLTTELFNPDIRRPLASYRTEQGAHNARYVSLFAAPFLFVTLFRRWSKKTAWLALAALATLIVCLAPPFLLELWRATPQMNKIVHVFYFYSEYWQISILLLAGIGMDVLFERGRPLAHALLRRWTIVLGALTIAAFFGALVLSDRFPVYSSELDAALYILTMLLAFALLAGQIALRPSSPQRALFIGALLVLAFTDQAKYFATAERADAAFTALRPDFTRTEMPLPPAVRDAFTRPWRRPDPSRGFEAGLTANMPFANSFWPVNDFLVHRDLREAQTLAPAILQGITAGPAVELFPSSRVANPGAPTAPARPGELVVGANPSPEIVTGAAVGSASLQWLAYSYNSFVWSVDSPAGSWFFVRQIYDVSWHANVDGHPAEVVPANVAGMALKLASGRHVITLDFRPLSRRLYWFAAIALQLTFAIALIVALRFLSNVPHPRRSACE